MEGHTADGPIVPGTHGTIEPLRAGTACAHAG